MKVSEAEIGESSVFFDIFGLGFLKHSMALFTVANTFQEA